MLRTDFISTAVCYTEAGLSVIPVRADGSKAPALKEWTSFQHHLPSEDELRQWFGNGVKRGIAVVCGAVSGNLAVLDFDDEDAYIAFGDLVVEHGLQTLVSRLPCAKTPGGYHYYLRTPEPLATQVLARNEKGELLVEVRGEGAYAIVPPSPAEVHPDGKPYELLTGDLCAVPQLTAEEVEDILSLVRALNRKVEPAPQVLQVTGDAKRVGDRYNEQADVLTLLQQHGWKVYREGRNGNLYLTRPGKERGVSASWHEGLRMFYVFSTNAPPFEAGRAYSPFAIYALLEHGGDFSAAAKGLAQEAGDGQSTQPVVPMPAPRRAVSLRDLMAQEFAPLTYLVPDILPEGGLCLLVGRPKVGKSWFALQVACALSAGGWTLGLEQRLPKRRVLYCALEDGLRRLQRRIQLLGTDYDPDAFHVVTELSAMDRGGLEELRELIHQTQAQVVFVDVVARILPRRKRSEAVYQSDYDAFALLKDLAVAEGVTIVAVHHENKNPSTDPLDRVSGSTGVTGAIDAVLSISKRRGEQTGTLFVTGRDIEKEAEYAVTFTAGKWYVEGDAREVQMSEERREILRAIDELGGKAKPTEIAQVLGKTSGAVRFLLHKMVTAGELQRLNGYYTNTANTANTANACVPPTNANTQEGVSTVSSVSSVSTVSTVSSVSTVTPITQSECLSNSDTAPESVQSSPARDASEDWCWVPPKRRGVRWGGEPSAVCVVTPPEQRTEGTIHRSPHSPFTGEHGERNITTTTRNNTTRMRVFTAEEVFAYGG
jgi:hypothetical protein